MDVLAHVHEFDEPGTGMRSTTSSTTDHGVDSTLGRPAVISFGTPSGGNVRLRPEVRGALSVALDQR